MRSVAFIPARYASSRFPAKPLVPLLGVPMVAHVARLTAEAVGQEHTYVLTDDARIRSVVEEFGYQALMTSSDALTGTDRLAEATEQVEADLYVNVQGDEPMLNPASIRQVIETKRRMPNLVANAMTQLGPDEDPHNVNIPKVVANEEGRMLYMSRRAVPGFKDERNAPEAYWKQVCIYAFTRYELCAFATFGRKSVLERSEDIEILRFLEIGVGIQMVKVAGGSLAVDVPSDVVVVERAMKERGLV
ncbi:MAG: 3-deoxy-manno-octulosonate cytidylyltransferase [Rhodothermales bacterium]|uniref:3-deoxy-manno-octulosonate cytidylyltransferase n=1 Tax=Roseibium sp. TaxID=1936156 RepID=UPI00327E8F4D